MRCGATAAPSWMQCCTPSLTYSRRRKCQTSVLVPNLKGAQLAIAAQADSMLVPLSVSHAHSLANLRKTPDEVVAEIGRIRAERDAAARRMMDLCGLPARLAQSLPSQISGGQRQRVAIASALVLRPRIVICDEPTSALDVSVQAQILNLFMDLQEQTGTAYVFISHNLAVVRHVSDQVGVMYLGRLVELADMRAGRMSDDDWTRMARRMSEITEAPLYIDDSPNLTMMEIRAKARRLHQKVGLKLIVLDYLQLMTSGKKVESRQQEVSEFSRQIKLLAKELEVPVVAMSQLNRGPEQRTDKKPMLADLRESGSIEQDSDMVILLHRPDAFERDDPRGGEADLIIAKHRAGPTKTVTVAHQLHLSRFTNMAH